MAQERINVLLNVQENISQSFRQLDTAANRSISNMQSGLKALKGALVAGGAVIALKTLFNITKEYTKYQRQVQRNLNTTGNETHRMVGEIKALADVYGGDFQSNLQAVNALTKEFGISAKESSDLISKGFSQGANDTGEFIDTVKEYSTQMKSAGIKAKDFISIITQQVKEGIYSDKGVDSIKEAGLRLREYNKATKIAISYLGKEKQKEIELLVARGKSFKAIQKISEALSETNLTAQQTQRIIADVFGGPGEDAGLRYLQTLKDINTELINSSNETNNFTFAQKELAVEWNSFQSSLVESDGIITKILTAWTEMATDLIKLFSWINKTPSKLDKFGYKGDNSSADELKFIFDKRKELNKILQANSIDKSLTGWANNNSMVSTTNLNAIKKQIKELNAIEKTIKKDKIFEWGINLNKNKNRTTSTPLPTTKLSTQPKVANIHIQIEKQIETVNIASNENPMRLKETLKQLMTEIITDTGYLK